MNLDVITIQSTAIYSSWCFYKPFRTLFDCGEGCASYFKNEVYAVERIFISHGHGDHILGLASFIGIRNSVRGDKLKPLDIYYPTGCWGMKDTIDYIRKRNRHLTYELNFIEINAGFTLKLNEDSYVKAFSMKHQKNEDTLGYKIVTKRNRLKPEFVGKNIPELIRAGVPKNSLTEAYNANEFAYCLDSSGFDYEEIRDCDLAVMDTTFLTADDRDELTHFTLPEVVSICDKVNVKNVVCAHISPRYRISEIRDVFNNLPAKYTYHTSKANAY